MLDVMACCITATLFYMELRRAYAWQSFARKRTIQWHYLRAACAHCMNHRFIYGYERETSFWGDGLFVSSFNDGMN